MPEVFRDLVSNEVIERFEREVQLASRLTHPNTIEIYDFGRTEEGVFYYAMEVLNGFTLAQLVQMQGEIPVGRVLHILKQATASIAEAHSIGLIHRDIKPQNIMLVQRGGEHDVVKVLDFGLVKDLTDEEALNNAEVELRAHSTDFPESRGMATTVVEFHPTGETEGLVYWVGDIRLYHLRDGKILFKTKDHSLVQMMIDKGEITEEQAEKNSATNVILQAVSDSKRGAAPDFHHLTDIQPGDRILLMTDGIHEGCPEDQLVEYFKDNSRKAIGKIRSICEELSSDNFSMIAMEIEEEK